MESHKANNLAPGTLWQMQSALKFYYENVLVKAVVSGGLDSYIKGVEKVHEPKKAKAFALVELEKFLIDAPNSGRFLQQKLSICMGLSGGPRGEETTFLLNKDLKVDDVQFRIRKDLKGNKTSVAGLYIIPCLKYGEMTTVEMFEKYMSLVKNKSEEGRFWQTYRESSGQWVNMAMGVNNIRKFPSEIASFLGLENPGEYVKTLILDCHGNIFSPGFNSSNVFFLEPCNEKSGSFCSEKQSDYMSKQTQN